MVRRERARGGGGGLTALRHPAFDPHRQVRSFLVRWSKRKEGFERINQVDEKGRGALSLALKEGREDIADFIISIGEANPNLADRYVLASARARVHSTISTNLTATPYLQGH